MRIVVTGGTGNVGSAVLRALRRDPTVDEIVGIARRRPAEPPPDVEMLAADVTRDDLVPLFRGADAVVHLAWLIQPSRDRRLTSEVNVGGSERVVRAAVDAGVPALVYASSVGAYSPGPKDRRVDESWPTDGVPSSFYARDKAAVERILDDVEREHPGLRVVRLRPGLIFQRTAASEIRRLFVGPFLPGRLVDPRLIPIVPSHPRLRFQAVHADDVAEAYLRAAVGDARGAFNVADEPVLDGPALGCLLHARPVRVHAGLLRALADWTWRLRLQPTPAGWVDMALGVPLMDTTRARRELGWTPRHDAGATLLELLQGMREGAGDSTPPLDPHAGGPLRAGELASGIGARGGPPPATASRRA
ncbi:MAG: NAD-dependent epimerase/dehydratase family protein [Solirubrobacterales bacterium]|nr:NAD-dependent epimerase/dehydratase family protein [Solirubrobacterales bacterium]